ncbi:MAG: FAD-linked oxidase C-terminal domain-containing protein [Candidatus Deferrimicrobium sp.]
MGYPCVTREDLAYLKQAIGEGHVSTGESNLDLHSRDESYHEPHRPDVVVWPQNTGDVVAAVKLAYMRRIKTALDPKGILNPGKMLPDEGGPTS